MASLLVHSTYTGSATVAVGIRKGRHGADPRLTPRFEPESPPAPRARLAVPKDTDVSAAIGWLRDVCSISPGLNKQPEPAQTVRPPQRSPTPVWARCACAHHHYVLVACHAPLQVGGVGARRVASYLRYPLRTSSVHLRDSAAATVKA